MGRNVDSNDKSDFIKNENSTLKDTVTKRQAADSSANHMFDKVLPLDCVSNSEGTTPSQLHGSWEQTPAEAPRVGTGASPCHDGPAATASHGARADTTRPWLPRREVASEPPDHVSPTRQCHSPTFTLEKRKQRRTQTFRVVYMQQSQTAHNPGPVTVDHNKLWKILIEVGTSDHLTCLLRNLCAGQEATVRTGHGTTDWFQIGEGVHQGCILSPWLFSLYEQYIMRNAGLDEAQTGIKIAGRNINNLR